MPFPQPATWNRETADIARENSKRQTSPCSFFCSQGKSLCLSADYFIDERLADDSRGGVASKHRHKLQLALFGQLMAAFEYMLKDFFAKSIDATSVFDDKIKKLDWLNITTERVLAQRVVHTSVGSTLIHPTLGWHTPEIVNERFSSLFSNKPIQGAEVQTLNTLWVLRHSVAHNAGFVTAHDAARINLPDLSERVVQIDSQFIDDAYYFLVGIASNLAGTCGKSILSQWFKSVKEYSSNYQRDQTTYGRIKNLGTCITSRTQGLPEVTQDMYSADWAIYAT
jgi:hypothetical protein